MGGCVLRQLIGESREGLARLVAMRVEFALDTSEVRALGVDLALDTSELRALRVDLALDTYEVSALGVDLALDTSEVSRHFGADRVHVAL